MANANAMTVFEIGGERRRCCCAKPELFALLLVLFCRLRGLLRSLPWSVLPNETTAREEREIETEKATYHQDGIGLDRVSSDQIRSDQIGSDWIPLKKIVDGIRVVRAIFSSFFLFCSIYLSKESCDPVVARALF